MEERQFRSGFSPLFEAAHFTVAMRFLALVNLRSGGLSAAETERSKLGSIRSQGGTNLATGGSE